MFNPPELDVSVTVTLRAPVPPLRDNHRRTGMFPAGMLSAWRSTGAITQESFEPPATPSVVSAVVGRMRDSDRLLEASRRR
jgi:hypothetical protein